MKVAMMVLAASMCCSWTVRAALTVDDVVCTRGEVTRIGVSFEASQSVRELYFAYGPTDCGDDLSDWPNRMKAAVVQVGETSAAVELPVGWQKGNAQTRLFLLAGSYPVDYIRGAGTHAIDTGVKFNCSTMSFELEFTPTSGAGYQNFFGMGRTLDNGSFVGRSTDDFRWVFGFARTTDYTWVHTQKPVTPDGAVRTKVTIDPFGDELSVRQMSGESYETVFTQKLSDVPDSARNLTSGYSVSLLARNDGTAYNDVARAADLHSCVMKNGGGTVLDLKPYVQNGIVGMKDSVGGGFFTNVYSTAGFEAPERTDFSDVEDSVAVSIADLLASSVKMTVAGVTSRGKTITGILLSFDALDAPAELYFAYGPTDCGGNLSNWPNRMKVAELLAGATSAVVEPPVGWQEGNAYVRFFILSGDYPLDYISGDGAHAIDTGVKFTGMTMSFEFVFTPYSGASGQTFYGSDRAWGYCALYGSVGESFTWMFGFAREVDVQWVESGISVVEYRDGHNVYTKNRLVIDGFGDELSLSRWEDGAYQTAYSVKLSETVPEAKRNLSTAYGMALLGRSNGVNEQGATVFNGVAKKADIHSCVIRNSGEKVIDLTPFRKDGVAGLLDSVNGGFYTNVYSTAAFGAPARTDFTGVWGRLSKSVAELMNMRDVRGLIIMVR